MFNIRYFMTWSKCAIEDDVYQWLGLTCSVGWFCGNCSRKCTKCIFQHSADENKGTDNIPDPVSERDAVGICEHLVMKYQEEMWRICDENGVSFWLCFVSFLSLYLIFLMLLEEHEFHVSSNYFWAIQTRTWIYLWVYINNDLFSSRPSDKYLIQPEITQSVRNWLI